MESNPAIERILGWAVAAGCVAAGGALLAGLVQPAAPRSMRLGCGVILVLLGVKRWAMTRMQGSRGPRGRDDATL